MTTSAKPAKRRTYNTRLVRRTLSYSVQEIADLFGLHVNSVRQWLKDGLPVIDHGKPILIHGGDLIDYLDQRQTRRKRKCRAKEIYCCRCHKPRQPEFGSVLIRAIDSKRVQLSGTCSSCGASMKQFGSLAKIPEYESDFGIQTFPKTRLTERADPSVKCHLEKEDRNGAFQSQE